MKRSSMINTERIIKEIHTIDWASYSGPDEFNPDEVSKALVKLLLIEDENDAWSTYNKVLFSIGNNHRGTYYSVAKEAIKYILLTAISGEREVARNCALNILVDLYGSFWPEPDNPILMKSVLSTIEDNKEVFIRIAENEAESERNRSLTRILLEDIASRTEENG